ncbi:nucleotide exchange factor GrpE [Dactylosporangium sp. NPDC005572]|uniref:nucleotide exchange factor GrpE n=1 Tax=Dactylosporangium sp. NPDC005572 TaxID=3156889 RepID=UPI0033A388E6
MITEEPKEETAEEANVEVDEAETETGTPGPVAEPDAVEGEIVDEAFTVHAPPADEPGAAAAQGTTDDAHQHGLGAELAALRTELDERTRDLQRVTAEYANYRKRVERDRALVVEQATGNVLGALLPVLDDLDRARDHGDLVGPFGAVAEQLVAALTKFGLTVFGSKGDPFDPTRHEAVAHLTSAEVTEPTCIDVMRRGYLLGERLLRPALVAVADPE